jgi:hypothetical protein
MVGEEFSIGLLCKSLVPNIGPFKKEVGKDSNLHDHFLLFTQALRGLGRLYRYSTNVRKQ